MKKYISLATAGLLLLSLQPARAQRQVEPPAVPPMLEGERPLAQPETREPIAPKQVEGKTKPKSKGKAPVKAKAKAGKKDSKKAAVKKAVSPKASKKVKKKGQTKQGPNAGGLRL
jgi:hypothetical protein